VNDAGLVVGYGTLPGGVTHAFAGTGPGQLTDLGTLPGGHNSMASGINASGVVVGTGDDANGVSHAFASGTGGGLIQLGGGVASQGVAINNKGVVVGALGFGNVSHAFRTEANGTFQDLGTLNGFTASFATAVDSKGDVVGYASDASGASRAFLFTGPDGGGQMFDLTALLSAGSGWVLTSANGINDNGQVTGVGVVNGQDHAFRLDPAVSAIPEPSTLTLAALGLVALIWACHRHKVAGGE
jgi:probable HAF family extracellular repeat protein